MYKTRPLITTAEEITPKITMFAQTLSSMKLDICGIKILPLVANAAMLDNAKRSPPPTGQLPNTRD